MGGGPPSILGMGQFFHGVGKRGVTPMDPPLPRLQKFCEKKIVGRKNHQDDLSDDQTQ